MARPRLYKFVHDCHELCVKTLASGQLSYHFRLLTVIHCCRPFQNLPEEPFDDPMLGEGSGGAQLFGTTGGVMEAALRTVYEIVTGMPMGKIVFEVRCSTAALTSDD